MDRFNEGRLLGKGTFGEVFLATKIDDGTLVAVKKMLPPQTQDEGVSFAALREVRFLRELSHPNVVNMLDVYFDESNRLCLVLELLKTDLQKVLYEGNPRLQLRPGDVKGYILMILQGLEYLHAQNVVHRDLKPGNVFISGGGVVKLADFGLARTFGSPKQSMTPGAITQWYRPPELLFGSIMYGGAVDMWSVGCIFVELWLRRPLFHGIEGDNIDQLGKIFMHMGTPTLHEWPGVDQLAEFVEFAAAAPVPFEKILPPIASAVDANFATALLHLNPRTRLSATEALAHDYFKAFPAPTAPRNLPR